MKNFYIKSLFLLLTLLSILSIGTAQNNSFQLQPKFNENQQQNLNAAVTCASGTTLCTIDWDTPTTQTATAFTYVLNCSGRTITVILSRTNRGTTNAAPYTYTGNLSTAVGADFTGGLQGAWLGAGSSSNPGVFEDYTISFYENGGLVNIANAELGFWAINENCDGNEDLINFTTNGTSTTLAWTGIGGGDKTGGNCGNTDGNNTPTFISGVVSGVLDTPTAATNNVGMGTCCDDGGYMTFTDAAGFSQLSFRRSITSLRTNTNSTANGFTTGYSNGVIMGGNAFNKSTSQFCVLPPAIQTPACVDANLELATASATVGIRTVEPQTATLLNNTTGTTFVATSPIVSATMSISNQQYTANSAYAAPNNVGTFFGAAAGTGSPTYDNLGAIGNSNNANFTSNATATPGTGIDINSNFGFRMFWSTVPLAGQPTTGRYQYSDITITFSTPVDNPIMHVADFGGFNDQGLLSRTYFSSEYELLTPGLSLTKLSSDANGPTVTLIDNGPAVTNGTYINTVTNAANTFQDASFRVNGLGVTSITFRTYIQGNGGNSSWNTFTTSGEALVFSFSIPDQVPTAPVPTATNRYKQLPINYL